MVRNLADSHATPWITRRKKEHSYGTRHARASSDPFCCLLLGQAVSIGNSVLYLCRRPGLTLSSYSK
jgi:hypothetical protein